MENVDVGQLFDGINSAVHSGNWGLVAALAVVALTWLARKFGGAKFPVLQTDAGGAALVLVMSIAAAVASAMGKGAPFSVALLLDGVKLGFVAAGGYATVKKLISPLFAKAGLQVPESLGQLPVPVPAVTVTPVAQLPKTLGLLTAEQKAALDAALAKEGYIANPDGTYTDPNTLKGGKP